MMNQLLFYGINFLFLGLVVSFAISPFVIGILYKLRITRRVSDFSNVLHFKKKKLGTPIMGGLIIILGIILSLGTLYVMRGVIQPSFFLVPVVVVLLSGMVGFIDDLLNLFGKKRRIHTVGRQLVLAKVHKRLFMRLWYWVSLPWTIYNNLWTLIGSHPKRGLTAGERFGIEVFIGLIMAWWITVKLNVFYIWLPLVGDLFIGWLIVPIIVFSIVFMKNAVNISDGMDGLAAGLLIAAFMAFGVIAFNQNDINVLILCAITIGSLLTYLYFNIRPARVQMGDVGSLAMGALLAVVAVSLHKIILLPVIGFVFVIELFSSLLQSVYRVLCGRRLFRMAPFHYHLFMKGWAEDKVVTRLWWIGAVCAIIGMVIAIDF